MAPNRASTRLRDILEAISRIRAYTEDKTYADFQNENWLQDAVERNIERVSEASRHLPSELKARHPDIPWDEIGAIGNYLRHEYFRIEPKILWDTVEQDLEPVRLAVMSMLDDED